MNDWSNYDADPTDPTITRNLLPAVAWRLRCRGRIDPRRPRPHCVRGHFPMLVAAAREWRSLNECRDAKLAQKFVLDAAGPRVFAVARRTIYLDLHRGLPASCHY